VPVRRNVVHTPGPAQRAGCLLGLALGDALGFVVEAEPPGVARAYVAELRAGRAGLRTHPGFPFGQYSDDTQLARELLLSVREAGCFDPAGFGRRLADLFTRGQDVGAGPGSRAAALRLARGVSWSDAGTPPPYAGNGSAMRAAPLGLVFPDRARLVEAAVGQSRLTHQDPRCAAGALTMAAAAAMAARPGAVDPDLWLEELSAAVAPVDEPFAEALRALRGWAGQDAETATRELPSFGCDPPDGTRWLGVSAHVIPSVLWALYAFLRSPDSYWDTVCTAIEAGGDTDSTAAMAGALAGARLGRAGLPEPLIGQLTDRGRWNSAALEELAMSVCVQ
jgi:ADP-ribosylglycohydrolase